MPSRMHTPIQPPHKHKHRHIHTHTHTRTHTHICAHTKTQTHNRTYKARAQILIMAYKVDNKNKILPKNMMFWTVNETLQK